MISMLSWKKKRHDLIGIFTSLVISRVLTPGKCVKIFCGLVWTVHKAISGITISKQICNLCMGSSLGKKTRSLCSKVYSSNEFISLSVYSSLWVMITSSCSSFCTTRNTHFSFSSFSLESKTSNNNFLIFLLIYVVLWKIVWIRRVTFPEQSLNYIIIIIIMIIIIINYKV